MEITLIKNKDCYVGFVIKGHCEDDAHCAALSAIVEFIETGLRKYFNPQELGLKEEKEQGKKDIFALYDIYNTDASIILFMELSAEMLLSFAATYKKTETRTICLEEYMNTIAKSD